MTFEPGKVLAILLWLLLAAITQQPALAQSVWQLTEVTDNSVPSEIVLDEREIAKNGLPDGRITKVENAGDVAAAWYSQPTGRYTHGVLGDTIEAGSLKVRDPRGRTYEYSLPRTQVFEDIAPRLIDLDNDGRTEIVTILSSTTRGAALAIFSIEGNALVKRVQTDFIGQKFRWLNFAGASYFTGSSTPEFALVQTPHIGGTLQLWKYASGGLIPLLQAASFSNHVIGSRELRLSAITDIDGNRTQDLALPSADRKALVMVGFTADGFKELARVNLPSPIDKAIAVEGSGNQTRFTVGLENGSVYQIHK